YRSVSTGLKELMLLSLLSASHAKVTAAKVHFNRREEAYLCGMFRNLGEVLLSCYLPKSYSEILVQIDQRGLTEREAARQVLGCTYEDLGEAAARHWNMPDKVTNSIQAQFPRLTKAVNSDSEILEALTSFSHGLTAAIHRKEPGGIRARLNHLIETHGPVLPIRLDEIQEIAEAAIAETKATFDLLQVPLDDLKLCKQAEMAMETMEREAESEETEADVDNLAPGPKMLANLTDEVEVLLTNGNSYELTNAILMVLEAMYRGVGFDRVLFGLVAPDHSCVRGRLGLGHRIDELLELFQYPLSVRSGPIGLALLRKHDLWVMDDRFPDWEPARVTGAGSFGLYPVIVNRVAVGCLYMEQDKRMRLAESVAPMVCRLRDLAGKAIEHKRAEANLQDRSKTSLPTPSE
ncbi:MAG: HDOD domain-containing protein, partial [bacterium]|nr:HDOD domain-containing protein [bacterium]